MTTIRSLEATASRDGPNADGHVAAIRLRACALTAAHNARDVRIFERECRSLAESGWEVVLVAPHPHDEVVNQVQIAGVPVRGSRLARFTCTAWDVYRRAIREDAAIYHFHDPELLPAGLLLRLRGRLAIYDAHEDVPATLRHREWLPRPLRRAASFSFDAFERLAARHMSAVVTVNDEIAARLGAVNPRTTVIRNYPRLAEFAEFADRVPGNPDRFASGRLVSFGGISTARSTPELVRAMGAIAPHHQVTMLLGGGVESTELLHDCERLPGWSRIDYRGQISREEMIAALRSAAASLIMFSPQPNHYSPGSNRLFESMAAGVPVIAPNFPRWRALVEGNGCGLVADPTDPGDIARTVEYILGHPEEGAEMGRRGKELIVRQCNWEREEGALIRLYDGIVAAKSDAAI